MPVVVFVTVNASAVVVVTAAVVSVPALALILTEPSALYSTVVLSPATIFALYLTIVLASRPELLSAGVYSIVAVVPLPFWNSTMSLFLTSNLLLTVGVLVF